MKPSILSLSLGLAALLVLAPASAIANAATGAEQVAGERDERRTRFSFDDAPEPNGPGRDLGQRASVTAHCQSHTTVNGSLHTADIEYHWEWRKPVDDQGRVIEAAAAEWTLVGVSIRDLTPAASSVC